MGEHVVLELGADLLLGDARLDVAADVAERLVSDALGGAHEPDLLGVLDRTEPHEVAMQARQQARHGALRKGNLEGIVEVERARVLDGHDAGMGLADAVGGGTLDHAVVGDAQFGETFAETAVWATSSSNVRSQPVSQRRSGLLRRMTAS